MTQTVHDEHDELSASLRSLIDTFRRSPDQTIVGWENLLSASGMTDTSARKAIRQARRMRSGRDGQLAVLPHGRQPTEFKWTKEREAIAKQRLRHKRLAYAYDLHVYWSEHQEYDRMTSERAPDNEIFDANYEMRKSQEALAADEAKIVSLGRSLGLPDQKIASFFRIQVTPNDPESVHNLVAH